MMSKLTLTAKTFGQRPSQLINLEDEYTSYCFDEVSAYFWAMLKNESIDQASKTIKKEKNEPVKHDNMLDFLMSTKFKKGGNR